MDFQSIEALSDENIEDLYGDVVFNNEDNAISVYLKSYYNVYCRTGANSGRTGTGWGVGYTDIPCGSTYINHASINKNQCSTQTAYKGAGGWHHFYNMGTFDACGENETGYACTVNCTYCPQNNC